MPPSDDTRAARPHFWVPSENVKHTAFKPQAGGSKVTRPDFEAHGAILQRQIKRTRDTLANKVDSPISNNFVIQISTPEENPIKNEKMRLKNLGFEILSYSKTNPSFANVIIEKEKFNLLEDRIYKYKNEPTHPGRSTLAVIESIQEVPNEDKIDNEVLSYNEAEACLISLYSALPEIDKKRIAQTLKEELDKTFDQESRICHFNNQSVAITACISAEDAKFIASKYSSIRSIQPNSDIVITKSIEGDPIPEDIAIAAPKNAMPVVVIDSGIKCDDGLLNGLVIKSEHFLPRGTSRLEFSHGTFVGSRIAFGDEFENAITSSTIIPNCPLIDIGVFGLTIDGKSKGQPEDRLITILSDVVTRYKNQSRVFNLSLGFEKPIKDNHISELAKNLDYLAREHDLTFIIAAGNIKLPHGTYPHHFLDPMNRIQPPAEALLPISVGSFARHQASHGVSSPDHVSSFSCRGPGSDSGQKPELVAHGGNILSSGKTTHRIAAYGLSACGTRLAYDAGTSFSAPIIASYASELFSKYPGATANLIKALLCHFAAPISSPTLTGLEKQYLSGLGHPNIGLATNSSIHSATYIYEGLISTNEYQNIPFWVPSVFIGSSGAKLKIRLTVIYDPPVDPDNSDEYSKSRLTTSINKRTLTGLKRITFSPNDHHIIKPWNPVIQLEKTFSRQFSSGEWEAQLRLFTRGLLPDDFKQRYALLIEVIDENKKIDIYNSILNEAPATIKSRISKTSAA